MSEVLQMSVADVGPGKPAPEKPKNAIQIIDEQIDVLNKQREAAISNVHNIEGQRERAVGQVHAIDGAIQGAQNLKQILTLEAAKAEALVVKTMGLGDVKPEPGRIQVDEAGPIELQ